MPDKIKLKTRLKGDVAQVQSLMVHPMETGSRRDPETGAAIPAHHITQVVFTHNGSDVMIANFSTAVSKNPYFSFSFAGAAAGDALAVRWTDNQGETAELQATL